MLVSLKKCIKLCIDISSVLDTRQQFELLFEPSFGRLMLDAKSEGSQSIAFSLYNCFPVDGNMIKLSTPSGITSSDKIFAIENEYCTMLNKKIKEYIYILRNSIDVDISINDIISRTYETVDPDTVNIASNQLQFLYNEEIINMIRYYKDILDVKNMIPDQQQLLSVTVQPDYPNLYDNIELKLQHIYNNIVRKNNETSQ